MTASDACWDSVQGDFSFEAVIYNGTGVPKPSKLGLPIKHAEAKSWAVQLRKL